MNWFILIFIFVFDPFAIVLLISANKAFDIISSKTKENIYGETIKIKKESTDIKESPIPGKTKIIS